MAGAQPRTSCRSLFKQLESPCSMPLYTFTNELHFNNQEIFQTYSSIHSINTSKKYHRHRPKANLSCFQKNKFYTGIKIFNSLPPSVQTPRMTRENFMQPYENTYRHTLLLLCR